MNPKDKQVAGTHYKDMSVQPWDVVDTWPMADTPFSATGANAKPNLEAHADAILRASGSALRHYIVDSTRQRILDAVDAVRTHDRGDLLDLISEAISDSLDVDWRPIDAAEYVVRALEGAGIVKAIEGGAQHERSRLD